MRLAVLLVVVALAGCASSPHLAAPVSTAAAACGNPCLAGDVEVILDQCATLRQTIPLLQKSYALPPGFRERSPNPPFDVDPEASQLVNLLLAHCGSTTINGAEAGPVSLAVISVIVDDPGYGAGGDLHQFGLQYAAEGVLLGLLTSHGFAAVNGTVTVTPTATGRTAELVGDVALQAQAVHGPDSPGSFELATTHYRPGAWFTEEPTCGESTPFTAESIISPGTSVLRKAADEQRILRGADGMDDGCTLSIRFHALA